VEAYGLVGIVASCILATVNAMIAYVIIPSNTATPTTTRGSLGDVCVETEKPNIKLDDCATIYWLLHARYLHCGVEAVC
jgi:hypothetical protein